MLINKIKKDLVKYIKSGDKLSISITRLLLAAIKDKEISLGKNNESDEQISDNEIMDIINKMIKQRNLSIKMYLEANRKDLADREEAEARMLRGYLPSQITEIELKELINKTVLDLKANSIRDMGKIMNFLKKNYSRSFDFQRASELVKEKLIIKK